MAATPSQVNLSFSEKAGAIFALISAIGSALLAAFTAPFRDDSDPPTVLKHILLNYTRPWFDKTTPEQRLWLGGDTKSAYVAYCKEKGWQPSSVHLPDGTEAFWVGDKREKADIVCIFYHGGGFNGAATWGHYTLCNVLQTEMSLKAQDKSVAFLLLKYDLAPEAPYPRQLQQSADLLRFALTSQEKGGLGKKASQIIIMGDSAGGNLTATVLAHIVHPHPAVEKVNLDGKLGGAIMMSPWIDYESAGPSFKSNWKYDFTTVGALRQFGQYYLGGKAPDNYNTPSRASAEWWEGIPVEKLLLVAGGKEMMIDDIDALAQKLKKTHPQCEVYYGPRELHAEPAVGPLLGAPESEQTKFVKKWLVENF